MPKESETFTSLYEHEHQRENIPHLSNFVPAQKNAPLQPMGRLFTTSYRALPYPSEEYKQPPRNARKLLRAVLLLQVALPIFDSDPGDSLLRLDGYGSRLVLHVEDGRRDKAQAHQVRRQCQAFHK